MFILSFFNAGCKRPRQLKGLSANTSTIIYAPGGRSKLSWTQQLNKYQLVRKPPGKVVVFLEVIHKHWRMSSFSPFPLLSPFSSLNKKGSDTSTSINKFFIVCSIVYWCRCETQIFSVTFWGKERMVKTVYIYVKKEPSEQDHKTNFA